MKFQKGHKTNVTHGHMVGGKSPTYLTWDGMHQRCLNPRNKKFKYYGAKGITICPEWTDFTTFLSDMGERPPGKTLDRKDGTKGYSKRNCRWATYSEQNYNRPPKLIDLHGTKRTLGEWASSLGISKSAICRRIAQGWPPETALTTSKYGKYGRKTP